MFFTLSNGMGNEGAENVEVVNGLQRSDSEDGKTSSVVPLAKYEWRFRQAVGRKKDVRWGKGKVHLTLDIVYSDQQGGKQIYKYEATKKGACFWFNKTNCSCSFGSHCKFAHVC